MPRKKQDPERLPDESAELKNRLEETEETLRAIRQYMVDAFVVIRENGAEVVTLNNTDFPYRMMVESMNEGAVTLIPDGTIFYSNPRFAEMVQADATKLVGIRLQDLIRAEQRATFITMLEEAGQSGTRGEFCLLTTDGKCVPVQLSIYHLMGEDVNGVAVLATDITERMEAEEKIRTLASELTRAEQQERHRISQILHDDLQQRLFAIKAQLSFLRHGGMGTGMAPDAELTLDQLHAWLTEAITIARDLSIDLSPVVLRGDGLSEAIAWLASQMKVRHGLRVDLQVKEDLGNLDEQVSALLFQSVRELLFNVVKHAGTLHVTVTLERVVDRPRITISDLGQGFETDAILNGTGSAHGLLIVQDRLQLMGGSMQVHSRPGEGTTVILQVPESSSVV